jgi:hypothetical protein
MRRTLAISLVLLFAWTCAGPLFAVSAESTLPACCRANGKHHCMMSAALLTHTGPRASVITDKCPHCPKALAAAHNQSSSTRPAQLVFAEVIAHSAAHAQTEARYRIAFSRSGQKRGPPPVA